MTRIVSCRCVGYCVTEDFCGCLNHGFLKDCTDDTDCELQMCGLSPALSRGEPARTSRSDGGEVE
jgi:hypothetical protein